MLDLKRPLLCILDTRYVNVRTVVLSKLIFNPRTILFQDLVLNSMANACEHTYMVICII